MALSQKGESEKEREKERADKKSTYVHEIHDMKITLNLFELIIALEIPNVESHLIVGEKY